MVLQELSKTEIASLITGAKAASAIVARIAEEHPDDMPKDEIRQWEIAALYHQEAVVDTLALSFKRRLSAGASIQPGPYFLEPDNETVEEIEERLPDGPGGFNCNGFNDVGWNDPDEIETKPEVKAQKAAKRPRAKTSKRGGRQQAKGNAARRIKAHAPEARQ